MDLLKKEIERKRKELEDAKLLVNICIFVAFFKSKLQRKSHNPFKTGQKKYFKRGDLEQKQADEFYQKQIEAEKQRTDTDSDHEKSSYQTVIYFRIFFNLIEQNTVDCLYIF